MTQKKDTSGGNDTTAGAASNKGPATTHANPNAASSSFRHGAASDAQDPQVQQISHDEPLPTLCDVVSSSLLEGRDPVRPTVSRMVLIGELPSKEDPPRVFFDDCIQTAVKRVNAADPTSGKGSSHADPMNIAGLFIELSGHFFHLVDSEPGHLLEYAKEIHHRVSQKKSDGVSKVHVILLVDDIVARCCTKHYYIEVPPSATSGQLPETYQLDTLIVEQVHKVLQLLQLAQSQSKLQVDNFLANAKNTQAALLPKTALIEKCISSQLCLTLEEYVQLFGGIPNVVRAAEILHPVEEPLPHAL